MNAQQILDRLSGLPVLAAGDLWLDRWAHYDPFQPGVYTINGTHDAPGGCAWSAQFLAGLGARVTLLGILGDDGAAYDLRRAGALPAHLITAPGPTAVTTRLINCRTGEEDAPRLHVARFHPPDWLQNDFDQAVARLAADAAIVLAAAHHSPAAGGIIGRSTRALLDALPTVWMETPETLSRLRPPLEVAPDGAGSIRIATGAESATVPEDLPAHPVDPHCAREAFSAATAAALAAGAPPAAAVRFAVYTTSVCMMKPGAAGATPDEILRAEREFRE